MPRRAWTQRPSGVAGPLFRPGLERRRNLEWSVNETSNRVVLVSDLIGLVPIPIASVEVTNAITTSMSMSLSSSP